MSQAVDDAAVIACQLHLPAPHRSELIRMRLVNELNRAGQHRLTLVTAPCGFGKTTLLSQWAAQAAEKTTYLKLMASDNDPAVFFRNLIAALQRISPQIGKGVFEMLQSPARPEMEVIVRRLAEQMGMVLRDYFILWDDYQQIRTPAVHHIAALFANYLPAQAHLIISSETDPPFQLAPWRATGALKEIRHLSLAFSMDEATALLNSVHNLAVPFGEVTALMVRCQGRPAALNYAAFCRAHYPTMSDFVREFENDAREAPAFLCEILLKHQLQAVPEFLSALSLLDLIHPDLAAAVSGHPNSRQILEELAAAGTFISSLGHGWFTLHEFARPLLQARLAARSPELIPELHARAARWYRTAGWIHPALHHALAGGDYWLAGEWIAGNAMPLLAAGQLASVAAWLNQLPPETAAENPMLSVVWAWVRLIEDRPEQVETHLENAHKASANSPNAAEVQEHIRAIRDYLAGDTPAGAKG